MQRGNGGRALSDAELEQWRAWLSERGDKQLAALVGIDVRTLHRALSGAPISGVTVATLRMSSRFLAIGQAPPIDRSQPQEESELS